MNKNQLELWFLNYRPGAAVWANEKSLLVRATENDKLGEYASSFAVNLSFLADTPVGEFANLHIATKMVSPQPVPLDLVNDLNSRYRFVRHAVMDENAMAVMTDIIEDSNELTSQILRKHMLFFDEATKRLKTLFSQY